MGYVLDRPSTMSCPDCGGAMSRESPDGVTLYRCHIGHVLTIETLLHAKMRNLEDTLAHALAMMSESAELCRQMADGAALRGEEFLPFEQTRRQALDRAEILRSLLESGWTSPER